MPSPTQAAAVAREIERNPPSPLTMLGWVRGIDLVILLQRF